MSVARALLPAAYTTPGAHLQVIEGARNEGTRDVGFASRAAFLLNANARAVTPARIEQLRQRVPEGDLYLSRSMEDTARYLEVILRRGYGRLFIGGGDGTLVGVLNALTRASLELRIDGPSIGVLKLGTGNAISYFMGAGDPCEDAARVAQQETWEVEPVDMVVCDDGTLTPFAGMGHDGAVLNDYIATRKSARSPLARRVVESVWGYLGAMMLRTVPRMLREPAPMVRLTSTRDAYRMVSGPNGDVEERIPAGTLLYEGAAPTVAVGSIPYYGYGFRMFPFARRKAGFIQVRVCDVPIPTILAHLFPSVWRGTFRHKRLHDFLVEDVTVESSSDLPYQVGGDAQGYATRLRFHVSERAIPMVTSHSRPRATP